MLKKHNKITHGYVIQTYVTLLNGSMVCQNQEFIAGDPVDYESMDGEALIIDDAIDTDKEVYCPFEMKQPKQIGTDGLKFICPSCDSHRLECVEDGPYTSEVVNIQKEGDFDYGEINASGDVDRFQCLNCGFVLTDVADEPINDNEELAKWCKKNCKQD
jgi:hypothetical protein